MRRLRGTENCSLSIGCIWWESLHSNSGIKRKVLSLRVPTLEGALYAVRLRWFGHLLRMPTKRLPRCTPVSEAVTGRWVEVSSP